MVSVSPAAAYRDVNVNIDGARTPAHRTLDAVEAASSTV
jgi:hypothetical protein